MELVDANDYPVCNARPEIGFRQLAGITAELDPSRNAPADLHAELLQLSRKYSFEPGAQDVIRR